VLNVSQHARCYTNRTSDDVRFSVASRGVQRTPKRPDPRRAEFFEYTPLVPWLDRTRLSRGARPLRITERAVPRNERSKTTAKNARVDARERHLWLVKRGGSLGGLDFDQGGSPIPCRAG
jgi:hypothetical protein